MPKICIQHMHTHWPIWCVMQSVGCSLQHLPFDMCTYGWVYTVHAWNKSTFYRRTTPTATAYYAHSYRRTMLTAICIQQFKLPVHYDGGYFLVNHLLNAFIGVLRTLLHKNLGALRPQGSCSKRNMPLKACGNYYVLLSHAGQCRYSSGGNRVANKAVLSASFWQNWGSTGSLLCLAFYCLRFFVTTCPVSSDSHKSGTNIWKDFVLCFVRNQAHKRIYTTVSYPENLVLSGASIRWGVEAIICCLHAHKLSFVWVHVYVLCVLILTGQSLLQLSIILYQRLWLFYFLLDATVTNAYILYKESVQKECSSWRSSFWGSMNIFYPVPTVANDPAFKILVQQFDCVSATSRIAWTSLNSTRFAWRDAEQEFARRLAVLSDLLILARLIAPAYTTRNSTSQNS